jgi:hypothetical protein
MRKSLKLLIALQPGEIHGHPSPLMPDDSESLLYPDRCVLASQTQEVLLSETNGSAMVASLVLAGATKALQ